MKLVKLILLESLRSDQSYTSAQQLDYDGMAFPVASQSGRRSHHRPATPVHASHKPVLPSDNYEPVCVNHMTLCRIWEQSTMHVAPSPNAWSVIAYALP